MLGEITDVLGEITDVPLEAEPPDGLTEICEPPWACTSCSFSSARIVSAWNASFFDCFFMPR